MNARADIDLVLPCYNPPSGWEERVATHFREVERLFSPVRFHLFIVSDGSRRGYEPETIDRLRQLIPNVCVVDYKPNRGKGYALRDVPLLTLFIRTTIFHIQTTHSAGWSRRC